MADLISVIMGVYNEQTYLKEALGSILDQTHDEFEFLIVDDASTDKSPDIVRSYDDPRITLLENETNRGLTYSLNRALEHATGKFVARQDADDVSEPDRFERQIEFLEKNEDVAVVGTGAHLIDADGQHIDRRVPKCDPSFEDFIDKGHLIHGSIMARRSVLEATGGYNEFFRYAQDQELWLRLAKDYPIANIPDPLYRHRIHDKGVYFSRKDESAMYGKIARDLVLGKTTPNKLNNLNGDRVLEYYEELSPHRRAEFHCDLATRYLRYGHTEPAQEECWKARKYEPYGLQSLLLLILAHLGPSVTRSVSWLLRQYLNTRIQLYNRFNCPYKFE